MCSLKNPMQITLGSKAQAFVAAQLSTSVCAGGGTCGFASLDYSKFASLANIFFKKDLT